MKNRISKKETNTHGKQVPMEARMLVTDFLHFKLESIPVNHDFSLLQGRRIGMKDRVAVFIDDAWQVASSPFRPDSWQPPTAHVTGKSTVQIQG